MLDEQHAHVALVGEPPDEARQLGALVLVETGGRLVEHHDRRARRHGPGDADQPAPAVRELLGRLVEVRLELELAAPRRPRSDGRSWWPGQKRSVTHDSREARRSLPARMFSSTLTSSNSSSDWNERRSPSRARWVAFSRSMRRPSSEIDPSAAGTKPGDRVDERRLPGAVRADQADDLAGPHLQRHVLHRHHRAEAHGEVRRSRAWRAGTGSTSAGGQRRPLGSRGARGGAAPRTRGRGRWRRRRCRSGGR